ncbi:collagen-like protein, partial [Aequorivita sp. KMM 9714]|uniref:collagen-like protein n=1 Tax=Aequorivita sp. KMM 9714 TaxID=2707173 RepID=UPI0013EB33D6
GSDLFVDNGDGTFTHTTVNGDVITFDANTTTLLDNGNGTYTLTNANGDTITVDVVGDVVTNIQNQGDIYNEIINLITNTTGSDLFVDNGDGTFTHTTVNGDVITFDANTTTLVDNGNGTYTLTNANGDSITIDVVGDVVTNIQNQGDIYNEIINLIDLNETATNLVDNGDGTITYTNEDNVSVIIDLATGPQGPAGEDGKSAYQEWLEAGNSGTEQDFLDSLIGATGPQGPAGEDGKSAYQEWLEAGNSGAEQDFLDSLIGATGPQGPAGQDGVVDPKDLTAGDASIIVNNGLGSTLLDTNIQVATGGITTDKLADGAVTNLKVGADAITSDKIENGSILPEDLAAAGPDQVLTTDNNGNPIWVNQTEVGEIVEAKNGLNKNGVDIKLGGALIEPTTITADATNTLAVAGLQTGTIQNKLVVAEADGTLRQIKAAMPKFFYMPAIIFDTSVQQSGVTRNLHAEYVAQFTGAGNPTLVSSAGASNAIPTLPASELEYHITYYDTAVFANLSIDPNGILTYDVIGNATEASYMTIVFVVKD